MKRSRHGAIICLLLAAAAQAAEVEVRATALAASQPELLVGSGWAPVSVPLYALIGLRARKLELTGFDDLSVSVSAWGSTAITGVPSAADVNIAYVEGLTLKRHLRARLGRHFVIGGAARMMA